MTEYSTDIADDQELPAPKDLLVCPEIHAAKAGRTIFEAGGNAMDAAIAAAFVQGVTNHIACGIGGSLSIYYFDATTGTDTYINAEELMGSGPVPAEWAEELLAGRGGASGGFRLKNRANIIGYKGFMVPGFIKGCDEAFRRFGSGQVTWREVLQPAIDLASKGFEVPPYSAGPWRFAYEMENAYLKAAGGGSPRWELTPGSKKLIVNDQGLPYGQGDWFRQEDLGRTLERIATAGADDFYTGEIGARMAADFEANDALVTGEDLRSYHLVTDEPLRGEFRGLELAAQPRSNGSHLIGLLQILDCFDLKALGHNTAEYIDVVSRAMHAAQLDYLLVENGDDEEMTRIERDLVSKDRARYWADRIRSGEPLEEAVDTNPRGTTHLVATDRDGNFASFNHSIGFAGNGVVVEGLGFLLNTDVGHYNPVPGHPNSIAPGKRFQGGSSLAVFDDGRPVLVAGAPGGNRITTSVVQTVLNVLVFDLDPRTAVTMPRFHCQTSSRIFLEPQFRESVADELRSRGWSIRRSRYNGRPQIITTFDGRIQGGSDPRGQGSADITELPSYKLQDDAALRPD